VAHHIVATCAEIIVAFKTGFDTVNLHRPTERDFMSVYLMAVTPGGPGCADPAGDTDPAASAAAQGLTLVHVRARLEQLQDTYMR